MARSVKMSVFREVNNISGAGGKLMEAGATVHPEQCSHKTLVKMTTNSFMPLWEIVTGKSV